MKNNLLYLSLLCFVFITTSALALNDNNPRIITYFPIRKTDNRIYPKVPVLKENGGFPIISAQSAMAVDLDSGVTLYEKDPIKPLLPASTTKIVTALTALDIYGLNQVLKVGKIKIDGQKMGLVWGESITFENLLKGLLIYSANDAAEVIAQNYSLGRNSFIDLMNKKAKDLGLKDTNFTNPTGLDNGAQYSTTKDLIVVSKKAMENPVFAQIVATKEEVVNSVDGMINHKLFNINKLLTEVEGVKGVKTGWTENARENLVTYIERDDKKIMIAVLGSSDRFGETKELIDWIFENYKWETVSPHNNQ